MKNKYNNEVIENPDFFLTSIKDLFRNNSNSSVLTESQAKEIWSGLSQRYAQGASGEVTSFINNPRANSIFNTIEYPALLKNSNVTNINEMLGAK